MRVYHTFEPVYDSNSKLLILGSFPSVKSREINFYYGHPQNRFWKLIGRIYGEEILNDIDRKKAFLLEHHIALWDSVASCEINGSSDSSITDVMINPIEEIIESANIQKIIFNGKTSYQLFTKHVTFKIPEQITISVLPSTSPANATYTFDRLFEVWNNTLKHNL
ncbi:MAG: DNA-deoxyinosine glycosylase [Clostridia bacterium]|nr:DNA-deoxyinosine glycosylase [Clostridia bacterium]